MVADERRGRVPLDVAGSTKPPVDCADASLATSARPATSNDNDNIRRGVPKDTKPPDRQADGYRHGAGRENSRSRRRETGKCRRPERGDRRPPQGNEPATTDLLS